MDIVCLKEKLGQRPDPKRPCGNFRHKLEGILVIELATLLCNGSDFEGMEEFGRERETEFRKFLELPNGISDESSFSEYFNG